MMRWSLPVFGWVLLVGCGDFDRFDRRQLESEQGEDRQIIINPGDEPPPPPPPMLDGGPPAPPAPDQGPPPPTPDQGPPPALCDMSAFELECFKLVNQKRSQAGLQPYKCTAAAVKVSRAYSQLMCDKGFFSHTAPGGSTAETRFKDAGIAYKSWVGENIAYGASTPAAVMQMWMTSPGHRAAIMSSSFTHIGVGYAPCESGGGGWFGSGQHYWTQNFYVPAAP